MPSYLDMMAKTKDMEKDRAMAVVFFAVAAVVEPVRKWSGAGWKGGLSSGDPSW